MKPPAPWSESDGNTRRPPRMVSLPPSNTFRRLLSRRGDSSAGRRWLPLLPQLPCPWPTRLGDKSLGVCDRFMPLLGKHLGHRRNGPLVSGRKKKLSQSRPADHHGKKETAYPEAFRSRKRALG